MFAVAMDVIIIVVGRAALLSAVSAGHLSMCTCTYTYVHLLAITDSSSLHTHTYAGAYTERATEWKMSKCRNCRTDKLSHYVQLEIIMAPALEWEHARHR